MLARAFLYLDGEGLTEVERVEIRVHLEECRPCLERVDLAQEVARLVSRLRGCSPCPGDLRLRIQAELDRL